MAADRPDGEWRLYHPKTPLQLVSRFASEEVARCAVDWSARGENRATLTLWSEQTVLPPGKTVSLKADHAAARR
jgi:hypothetical protein